MRVSAREPCARELRNCPPWVFQSRLLEGEVDKQQEGLNPVGEVLRSVFQLYAPGLSIRTSVKAPTGATIVG